ncbi:extracellular solute-binding protein [Phaeacidiphilus oryzae]|uniref:extracellular solute-binding protein n=1 Tax=Phaeacidiphilus oryzae TaxID=348818 RepID=UPI000AE039CA|nr:extracellular solute-binding protein [Phaeacidiphilus oryzae]
MLSLSAIGVVGVFALSACSSGGGSGSSADGTVTLKFIAADYGDPTKGNSSQQYWDQVAAAFEKQNPKIKIQATIINWNDIDSKVQTMIQNHDYPDVLQTGGYANFVPDGLLYKADQIASQSTLDNFIPSFLNNGKVGGTQYGIPFDSSTRMMVYNTDIFKKAGITSAPKTWDDIAKDAQIIKSKGLASTPYALPLGKEEAQAESYLWELGNGGGPVDTSGKFALNSAANVQTFQWIKSNLVDKGLTYPNPGTVDRTAGAWADFQAGKAAMVNAHPTLVTQLKAAKVPFAVTPIPGKTGPLTGTLGVADWMMGFKNNGHADQIKKWIDFLYSDANTMKFLDEYNLMPVTQTDYKTMSTDAKYADLKPWIAQLPSAKFYPLSNQAWDTVSAQIKTEIGQAATGNPAQVLGDLQKKAQTDEQNVTG